MLYYKRNSYFLESTNNINILNVINIIQESQNYCVPASIQMILNYFEISLRQYSQARIYSDLGGDQGLDIFQTTIDYINSALTTTSNRYNLLSLGSNFGINNDQLVMFQDYVNQSIL